MSGLVGVRLDDGRVFSLISGLWTGKKPPFKSAAVLRSTNFRGDGLFDFGNVALLDVEERQLEGRQLRHGDIVIERSGGGPKQPVGRVALFDPPDDRQYATSNFTTALRVIDRNAFAPEYVSLFLHALYLSGATESLQRATTGIRNLEWSVYQSFEIPLLPMEDQKLLVGLLSRSRASALITEAQSVSLAELKRAAMRTLFTRGLRGEAQRETEIGPMPESWDVASIGDVAMKTQYGLSVRGQPSGTYPILRMNCQEAGKVHYRNLQFVELDLASFEAFRLNRGDLLFNRTNSIEHVGRMAIVEDERPAVFASYLVRLAVDDRRCLPRFLNHFMNWPVTQAEIKKLASRAVGQANINASKLRTVRVPLPGLDEQREIVAILDAIDRKINLNRRKRAVLDDLFKALLHKLIKGEIRVADLDLEALKRVPAEAPVA